jgi:DNA-binding LytR/AlgR family response regulator
MESISNIQLNCVVTDDEPFARKGIISYINKISFLKLVGEFENALSLNEFIKSNTVDLIFLDVQMPYISGLDFLKTVKNSPSVILTTAFEKYALEGYELEVLDYLLKPISFERFLKAANKALNFHELKQNSPDSADYFFIKCGHKIEKIIKKEILYIESMQNYIHIQCEEQKYTAHQSLKSIKVHLEDDGFIQPHKSYLVPIERVKTIEGNMLKIGKFTVPISKYLKEEVLKMIVDPYYIKKKD